MDRQSAQLFLRYFLLTVLFSSLLLATVGHSGTAMAADSSTEHSSQPESNDQASLLMFSYDRIRQRIRQGTNALSRWAQRLNPFSSLASRLEQTEHQQTTVANEDIDPKSAEQSEQPSAPQDPD